MHFDEAKASTALRLTVTHDYGIKHGSELLKIVDKVALDRLESEATDKQLNFIIRTFYLEGMSVSRATRYEYVTALHRHHTVHGLSALRHSTDTLQVR